MKKSILSVSAIGKFIEDSLSDYVAEGNHTMITDVHLQLQPETGELTIFNDDDVVLSEVIVDEWKGGDEVYHTAESYMRDALVALRESGNLETLDLVKPYSFVLIDKEKETIAELLIVDEQNTLFLSDNLLNGLDEELDAFLKELLEK